MPFAVRSSLDVVFWLTDRALDDKEYLQPQKLHRLMYLAQAYYSVAYPGRRLMPAVFVTDAFGPIEPTVFHMLSYGRPHMVEANPIAGDVAHFLDSIWRRFGQYTADQLTKRVVEHNPVAEAMAKGPGEEIPFAKMVEFYASEAAARKGAGVETVVRPRVMRSQTGKPVSVMAWTPKAATVKKDEG
ncbi:MAG: Panacea domain-containing protein [Solirubrobacterales bacterium]